MPRKIPHLAETILDQAARLFADQGYHAVDMKQVAAAAGTSVGNLYNYHKSKPDLFLEVARRHRAQLVVDFRATLVADLPRRERALAVTRLLFERMARWSGLLEEFFQRSEDRQRFWTETKGKPGLWTLGDQGDQILADLEALIRTRPDPRARWARALLVTTFHAAKGPAAERADNWTFLQQFLETLCES